MTDWKCPGCDCPVRARAATQVMHECPKRGYRLTVFKRIPVDADLTVVSA